MMSHLALKSEMKLAYLDDQYLQEFPKTIRSSIYKCLFYKFVSDIYLFKGLNSNLISQIVAESKVKYIPPYEEIILQNELPNSLYIVVVGKVVLIGEENGGEEVEVQEGSVVGDIGVLYSRPQPYTARSTQLCQLLQLDASALHNIIGSNSNARREIMKNLMEHWKSTPIFLKDEDESKDEVEGSDMIKLERNCVPRHIIISGVQKRKFVRLQVEFPKSMHELFIRGCKAFDHVPLGMETPDGIIIEDFNTIKEGDTINFIEGTSLYLEKIPDLFENDDPSLFEGYEEYLR